MEKEITIEEAKKYMLEIANIKNLLREKKVIRSEKIILSDYAEWFVIKLLTLKPAKNSNQKDWDAEDDFGKKYQIKLRTDNPEGSSGFTHITMKFDFLIIVFADSKTYELLEIYKIPKEVVKDYLGKNNTFRWKKESKKDKRIERIYFDF